MTLLNHANLVRANPALNRPAVPQLIWHRKRIILITVIACMAIALALSGVLPKSYVRTCGIVVEPATARGFGENISMGSYLNTQAELLARSTAIHANAVSLLMEKGHVGLKTFGDGHDKLAVLRSSIAAVPGRNDDVITLSFSSPYANEAAFIV